MQNLMADHLWESLSNRILLDVRSPQEFAEGHIPGAFNLPLFSDAERSEVGTLYKRASKEQAFIKGLDFVGVKLSGYVQKATSLAPLKKVILHCWRGGLRSKSMATLLQAADFDVQLLDGGYKAYRAFCREVLTERAARLILVGGKTGTGKTDILIELRSLGEQVIDLEGLAHHKGSVFGMLGEKPQPTNEQFENNLYNTFPSFDPNQRIWLESESPSIGQVFIPDLLYKKLRNAPMFVINRSIEDRVVRLVTDYGKFDKVDLIRSFAKIEKRLGGQNLKEALAAIELDDGSLACKIALSYYDKAYERSMNENGYTVAVQVTPDKQTDQEVAHQLIKIAEKNGI
jgi:tRNA 2-selenouridine synthase